MKSIETQIAEALGVEIEECHEYSGELYLFSLKGTTDSLAVHLDQSRAVLADKDGNTIREVNIKCEIE